MFLKGNLIVLRALEPSDAEILYKWENDMSLWPISSTQIPFSKFILHEFVSAAHQDIYTNKQLRLMVIHNLTNQPIGIIDLFDFDSQHARCGIGIYIDEENRKNGFAYESIALIKKYCFFTLYLKQMYVHVNQTNSESLALFEKSGFEKCGLKKCWNKIGIKTFEDVWFLQCINNGD